MGILLEFPVGYPALLAGVGDPFVSKPPGCPGAAGIVDPEMLAAVGGDFQKIPFLFQGPDSMEDPGPRGP